MSYIKLVCNAIRPLWKVIGVFLIKARDVPAVASPSFFGGSSAVFPPVFPGENACFHRETGIR